MIFHRNRRQLSSGNNLISNFIFVNLSNSLRTLFYQIKQNDFAMAARLKNIHRSFLRSNKFHNKE